MPNAQVFVAVYEHRYGEDLRAFATESKALAWKTQLALEWWEQECDDMPKPDESHIGDAYFSLMNDSSRPEYFTIHLLDVEAD